MAFVPKGIIIPVITPVDENGDFSPGMYRKLMRFWRESGVHGVFPFGTTGEYYAFPDSVFQQMLEISMEEAEGRMTVYAGTNSITPKGVLRLARIAENAGVSALSVLTPMFISQTQDELFSYYQTISQGTSLPIIIYNNRPKTNVHVLPETIAKLAEIPNIIAVKDSTGDMTNAEEYIRLTRHRNDFHVLMGRDTMILAGLHYGCTGAITSCGNVAPKIAVDIYENFSAGNYAAALEAQFLLSALRVATNAGTFPVVIKEAMKMIGFDAGDCAAPIKPLRDAQRTELASVLHGIGLIN